MSYDDDYDDEDEYTPIVAVEAALTLNTPTLDLNAKVGRQTVADLICQQALAKLAKRPEWDTLKDRVRVITDEQIREHVTGLIADALNGDLRRTNTYGEPSGEPTTLRTLIAEEAKRTLTQLTDNYRGPRETVIGKLVREEVEKAMKAELVEAIAAEKTKVVTAVREKAGQLIAEAVTAGIGTGR
jgi:uncharacterized membrane protein YheB (UPF0754 family)